jgi:DNA-binding NarL/FixJ family response regulator
VEPPEVEILIDQVPAMMMGIIREVVAACPRVRVVAENVAPGDVPAAVEQHRPDVIILGNARALGSQADVANLLGQPRPPCRIVTLFDEDRAARLHQWQRSVTVVEKPSAASLRAAILGDSADG